LEWLDVALGYPGVRIVELSPRVAAESTALPGDFHKDPVDQIIVATAGVLGCPLLTVDQLIMQYPHVQVL
jgi:PIN domain nuclease of toxin-antitoxin system